MSEQSKERKIMLLRYAEIALRKARHEANPNELREADEIKEGLKMSDGEIIAEAEALVKKSY